MRGLANLFKSLLIGGLVFLLPFGVIIVVFGKLLALARGMAKALHKWIPPGAESEAVILAIAILILVLLALAAGIFARTEPGRHTFAWFERTLLSNVPLYTLFRQLIPSTEEAEESLGEIGKTPVVKIRLDDQTLLGLLTETTPDGKKIVYIPDAPTGFSGTIAVMDADRVEITALQPRQLMHGMRSLGAGMAARLAEGKQAGSGQRSS